MIAEIEETQGSGGGVVLEDQDIERLAHVLDERYPRKSTDLPPFQRIVIPWALGLLTTVTGTVVYTGWQHMQRDGHQKMEERVDGLREDVARMERRWSTEQSQLRNDIQGDLDEIKDELKEIRGFLMKNGSPVR